MVDKQEHIRTLFTEKGLIDHINLLKTFIKLYDGEDKKFIYSSSVMILGFGNISIESKEELYSFIKCLAFLLGANISQQKVTKMMDDGTKVETIKLELLEVN